MELPEIKNLEFVQLQGVPRSVDSTPGEYDLTWILVYTGTLYFCIGGKGYHSFLFTEKMKEIPVPPPPGEWKSKMNSVIAAGRIKDIRHVRLHLWGSTDLGVTTPADWYPALRSILEDQALPRALASIQ